MAWHQLEVSSPLGDDEYLVVSEIVFNFIPTINSPGDIVIITWTILSKQSIYFVSYHLFKWTTFK